MQSVTPPRAPDSVNGLSFTDSIPDALCQAREDEIVKALLLGNVPTFMRTFCNIIISGKDVTGVDHELKFYVMPDYLCVGEDEDFVRVPLNPLSAQAVADEFSCTLPTKKIVDLIWQYATVKLEPNPIPPDAKMSTTKRFVEHNRKIEKSRSENALGLLTAGHKKDVVTTNRLLDQFGRILRKVAIYGWQWLTGKVIQDLNPTSHDDLYADYSHGIRLVALECELDGELANVREILSDPVLWTLLSDEGPMKFLKYPKRLVCTQCNKIFLSTDVHPDHDCLMNVNNH